MRCRAKGDEDPIQRSIASHQATALGIGNEIQSMSKLNVLTRFLLFRFRPGTMLVVISRPRSDSHLPPRMKGRGIMLSRLPKRYQCRRRINGQDNFGSIRHSTHRSTTDDPQQPSIQITLISIDQLHTHANHSNTHHILQPIKYGKTKTSATHSTNIIVQAFNGRYVHCHTDTDTDSHSHSDWLSLQSESTSTLIFHLHFISFQIHRQ